MNKKLTCIIVTVLIAACLLAYGRVLNNGFVSYDDEDYLTKNTNVQSGLSVANIKWAFTSVVSNNWHPLTMISHMADWSMFKDHAGGHHLVSLLLHIGNVLLLFLFLKKATGNFWPAAFAAAFFALHPLRVESVAWASERKDVLSMFFGLATLYTYTFYAEKRDTTKYILCLILFALGLMAKPMLVTFPFVLLLLDYWPLKRWQKEIKPVTNETKGVPLKKKDKQQRSQSAKQNISVTAKEQPTVSQLLWEKVPFFILTVISVIITVWAQYRGIESFQKLPVSERIANAIVSYISYLGKTFWPVDLAVFYPYQHAYADWQILGSFFILLGISIAVIYFVKKAPFLLVGWFWYLGTLVPVIGLVQVGKQAMADRYTYLPAIGIVMMVAWSVAYFFPAPRKKIKMILMSTAVAVLVALSFLTWLQCGYWKNSISLFSHALQATKNNYLAHDSLGVALDAEGKHNEAIFQYQEAIKINPDYDNAYYNLANAFKDQGDIGGAEKYFRETIRINPNYVDAQNNLGIILEMYYKKYDEAIYHYRQALKIQPDKFGVHYNMGIALLQKGEPEEAVKHFRAAIYLKPDFEAARQRLRMALEAEKNKNIR